MATKTIEEEVKLRNHQGGTMIVSMKEGERLLEKYNCWTPIGIRTKIEKDSDAARAAQHEGVTISTCNVFHPFLRLEQGTNYKDAMKAIRGYRQLVQVFSWLSYNADWR